MIACARKMLRCRERLSSEERAFAEGRWEEDYDFAVMKEQPVCSIGCFLSLGSQQVNAS
jgi:hypothetical protein